MTDVIRYTRHPIQDSEPVSVWRPDQLVPGSSDRREDAATQLDATIGDWTVYAVRETNGVLVTPANPSASWERNHIGLELRVGHTRVATDTILNLSLNTPGFMIQDFDRGFLAHIVGSSLTLKVQQLASAVSPNHPESDFIKAWVAPGRPSLYKVVNDAVILDATSPTYVDRQDGTFYSFPWLPVPVFARTVRLYNGLLFNFIEAGSPPPAIASYALALVWLDWRGFDAGRPVIVGYDNNPTTWFEEVPVPTTARFVLPVAFSIGGPPIIIEDSQLEWGILS